jgi:hypothetical protein
VGTCGSGSYVRTHLVGFQQPPPPSPPPPAVTFAVFVAVAIAVAVAVAVMTATVAVATSSSPPLTMLLVPLLVVAFSARPAAYQLNHQDENVFMFPHFLNLF